MKYFISSPSEYHGGVSPVLVKIIKDCYYFERPNINTVPLVFDEQEAIDEIKKIPGEYEMVEVISNKLFKKISGKVALDGAI